MLRAAYWRVADIVGVELDEATLADLLRFCEREEDGGVFDIGHPDGRTVGALAVAVEGARSLCAVEDAAAARMLRLAADMIESGE